MPYRSSFLLTYNFFTIAYIIHFLQARLMFDGEFEGLSAIACTNTVAVPKTLKVLDNPDGGACLVMEFLEMKGLRRFSQQLGDSFAKLHMHNESLRNVKDSGYVREFGFHTPTCCGYIPQENSWNDDWVVSIGYTYFVVFLLI